MRILCLVASLVFVSASYATHPSGIVQFNTTGYGCNNGGVVVGGGVIPAPVIQQYYQPQFAVTGGYGCNVAPAVVSRQYFQQPVVQFNAVGGYGYNSAAILGINSGYGFNANRAFGISGGVQFNRGFVGVNVNRAFVGAAVVPVRQNIFQRIGNNIQFRQLQRQANRNSFAVIVR